MYNPMIDKIKIAQEATKEGLHHGILTDRYFAGCQMVYNRIINLYDTGKKDSEIYDDFIAQRVEVEENLKSLIISYEEQISLKNGILNAIDEFITDYEKGFDYDRD